MVKSNIIIFIMKCINKIYIAIEVECIKMRYLLIGYVCCPCFYFPSESLLFTPNPCHYTPKFPCSSPNGLLFTLDSLSGYIPMIAVPYVRHGGWGVLLLWSVLREARCSKLVRRVYLNGWGCAGVIETILVQYIYCTKPNPKLNSHSSFQVCKGLGTQAPRYNW